MFPSKVVKNASNSWLKRCLLPGIKSREAGLVFKMKKSGVYSIQINVNINVRVRLVNLARITTHLTKLEGQETAGTKRRATWGKSKDEQHNQK